MKQVQKRVGKMVAVLLCLCLCLGCAVGNVITAEAADTTTVYFLNSNNWSNVNAYVWGDSESLGAWPGTQAQSDGSNWKKVTVPRGTGFNIIFNDGNGNQAGNVYITDSSNVYVTMVENAAYSSKSAAEAAMGMSSGSQPDIKEELNLSGVGAVTSFVELEAESANTNGSVLAKSTAYSSDIQSEASGRQAVQLDADGEYVEFTLTEKADCMVVRYCIPDSGDGAGIDKTLSMYVDGSHKNDISVTSRYAWVYGEYPFNNNPGNGTPHRFFDEVKVHFGQTYSAGTKIRLQKDSGDSAGYYIIDLADFEESGAQIGKPNGFISVADYGATPNDGKDDYDAIVNCINTAKSQGQGVYLPAGVFDLITEKTINVNGVTIQGAGMWHTTLYGAGAAFKVSGTCQFSDFAMTGVSTIRDDAGDLAGFEGYDASNDVVIQNIWMSHMKVGCWFYNTNKLTIQGCRIRDTYADGINMCSNVHNSVIQNNHLRNTGDDAIAIWPWQGDSNANIIRYNTVQCPTLANCVAIYGGADNQVVNNYLADNIAFGGGVNVSTNFETPNGFTGNTVVSYNTLVRCGSYEHNLNYPRGAIWIFGAMRPVTAGVTVHNNTIRDSVNNGITIDGEQEVNNVTFSQNYFYGITENAIHVRGGAVGKVVFDENYVYNMGGKTVANGSSKFTVEQKNGGLQVMGAIESGAKYRIVSKKSGKVLDIEGGTTNNGNVIQWQSNGGKNQQWYFELNSDGSYTIKSVLDGKVLDVEGNSTADGGNIIVWSSNGQDNQKWLVEDLGNGYFSIRSKKSGKSIDVEGNSTSDGANVIQWGYHGNDNQQWKLEKVE